MKTQPVKTNCIGKYIVVFYVAKSINFEIADARKTLTSFLRHVNTFGSKHVTGITFSNN